MLLAGTGALVASLITGCCGLAALRFSWRKGGHYGRLATASGWGLLAGCLYFASAGLGSEFGLSYALAALSVGALGLVALNVQKRPAKPLSPAAPELTDQAPPGKVTRKLLTFMTAGPLAGVASCQLTLVVMHTLPIAHINGMAAAAMLFPVTWGVLAYASTALNNPARYAVIFSAVAAFCSFVLYFPDN